MQILEDHALKFLIWQENFQQYNTPLGKGSLSDATINHLAYAKIGVRPKLATQRAPNGLTSRKVRPKRLCLPE